MTPEMQTTGENGMTLFQRLGVLVPLGVLVGLMLGWLIWSDSNCDGVLVTRAWPPGIQCVAELKEVP